MNALLKLGKRPFFRRLLFLGAAVVLLVFLPALTLAPVAPAWTPEPLKLWAYDMRLLIGRPITTLGSLQLAVAGETAVSLPTGQPLTLDANGFTLTATLYQQPTADLQPGILLLHGSTPHGRRLGMYRVLGEALAEAGYTVLAIDQRGYNWSDNPATVREAAAFDFAADVAPALDFLAGQPGVDPDRLFLIGHSFGGDVALTAVADKGVRVDKLVIIGPGRRFMERGGSPDLAEFDYFKRRDQRYMLLWRPFSDAVYLDFRASLPVENHLDYLAAGDAPPILWLDGELESADDREFLQAVAAQTAGISVYDTIPQADHYANVGNIGPLLIYDRAAIAWLVAEIDAFLSDEVP